MTLPFDIFIFRDFFNKSLSILFKSVVVIITWILSSIYFNKLFFLRSSNSLKTSSNNKIGFIFLLFLNNNNSANLKEIIEILCCPCEP